VTSANEINERKLGGKEIKVRQGVRVDTLLDTFTSPQYFVVFIRSTPKIDEHKIVVPQFAIST
jgi:hypothetical protein